METDDRACFECIGETFLRLQVQKQGEAAKCSYCGKQNPTFTLEQLGGIFATMFKHHYRRTPSEPSGFEYTMLKEEGLPWDREGEPVADVIMGAGKLGEELSKDIQAFLADQNYDLEAAQMGEEGPFDGNAYYIEAPADDRRFQEKWAEFERILKTEARHFSRAAHEALTDIFSDLDGHQTTKGKSIIVTAGPKTPLPILYRARAFQSDSRLEEALMRPDKELGPPPWRTAAAGRMNARGVSVFYGATDCKTALAEVRPPVGSRVVVAKFSPLRKLKLLDVAALQRLNVRGSLFDEKFVRQLAKARFLRTLSSRMTAPIMPDDEPFDYLPTQAVADFLANEAAPPLDGIIYPSCQATGEAKNVVLFHKASRVKKLDIPEGTKLWATVEDYDEDGAYPEYFVLEEIPAKKAPKSPFFCTEEVDGRPEVLEVDASTLEVHAVHGFTIASDAHVVRRHRSKAIEAPDTTRGFQA